MSLDGSMRGGRRPGYPPSGLASLEGSMRGGMRLSYQSVRALFEEAEEGGATRPEAGSPPPAACPSPKPQPSQQPPLALLERLSARAPMLGLERLSFQGAGLRGGLPLASREASRACSIEGSFRGGLRCWSGEGLDQLAAAGLALPTLPRPVLAYTGKHHSLLERRCQEALSILDRVQRPAPLRRGAPATGGSLTPQLPKTAFRFAKGLVFVSNQRAGALAGYSWGHGVLIARLPGGWSAPLLLHQRSGSLGLLLGWQRIEACHVLQTDDQVHAFAGSHGMELGAEGADAAASAPRHKDGGAVRLTGACSATLADGVFWDTSPAAGSTFVDTRMNASLYGDGVTAAEILGGRVALPQEFLPLYQAIDALAAEAQTTRHTLSKFSLVRQQSRQQQQQQQQQQAQPRQLARELSNASASSTGSVGPGPSLLRRIRSSFRRRSGSSMSARGCDSPTPRDSGWRRSVSSTERVSGEAAGSPSGPSEEPSNDFKLFGGVSIDFEERFTYEAQEAAEAEAEERQRAAEGAAEPPAAGPQAA